MFMINYWIFMPQAMEKIQEMLNGNMTNYDDLESKENN